LNQSTKITKNSTKIETKNDLLFFKSLQEEYIIIKNNSFYIYLKLKDIDNLFIKLYNKILQLTSQEKIEEFKIFTNRTEDIITGLAKILKDKNDYNNSEERIKSAINVIDEVKYIPQNNIRDLNEENLKDFDISLKLFSANSEYLK